MEARKKSGSLITADLALEQGKDVYALPGPADSALSDGCNRLIRQGAAILISPEELLEELGISGKQQEGETRMKFLPDEEEKKKMLESHENLVYSSLCLYPKSLNQIVEETCLSAQEVVCSLVSLEIQGFAEEKSKNFYIRK
jgi:DNA processing protein